MHAAIREHLVRLAVHRVNTFHLVGPPNIVCAGRVHELDSPWQEALAVLEGERHRGVLDDAASIAEAEESRRCLVERLAASRVLELELPGMRVCGVATEAGVDALLVSDAEATWLIRSAALLGARGVAPVLPDDQPGLRPTFAGLARSWHGLVIAVLRVDAQWRRGRLVSVGSDHVELACEREAVVLPFTAIAAMRR